MWMDEIMQIGTPRRPITDWGGSYAATDRTIKQLQEIVRRQLLTQTIKDRRS